MKAGKNMGNNNYIIFDILGVKHDNSVNSFEFEQNAECVINNDQFINKIVVTSDISQAIFFLHDSIEVKDDQVSEIVDYLSMYLGNMMIALLKNSLQYLNVSLKPAIRFSKTNLTKTKNIQQNDYYQMRDSVSFCSKLSNGNEILKNWVQNVDIPNYTKKRDRYNILFLLIQGENIYQKYMAMYAYLMSLVRELYSNQKESQKQVVKYISDHCSRVGIKLITSPCTRPGAGEDEKEDQFTALRNKIAHPSSINSHVNIYESNVNQLASIICCAIEDIS